MAVFEDWDERREWALPENSSTSLMFSATLFVDESALLGDPSCESEKELPLADDGMEKESPLTESSEEKESLLLQSSEEKEPLLHDSDENESLLRDGLLGEPQSELLSPQEDMFTLEERWCLQLSCGRAASCHPLLLLHVH